MTVRSTTETQPPRFFIGQAGISAVTMGRALQLISQQVRSKEPAYACVANVRTVVLAQKDAEFCRIQNESFLTVPDGMPLVWYARLAGVPGVDRVTGPDLMLRILEVSPRAGYSHYFYGDTEATLSQLLRTVAHRYPGIAVKGAHSPPFRPFADADVESFLREVNRLRPTFAWIALGAPKQERFIARVIRGVDTSVLVGVGAAFRFLIGEYKHPPAIVQKCGLEGVCWRFLRNPLREGAWYARHVPAFGLLTGKMLAKRLSGSKR